MSERVVEGAAGRLDGWHVCWGWVWARERVESSRERGQAEVRCGGAMQCCCGRHKQAGKQAVRGDYCEAEKRPS